MLADDISGAQDSAGRLAERGMRTYVSLDLNAAPPVCDALAASLETRLLGPNEAQRRSRWGWLSAFQGAASELRFQKIDSTLRGWPGPDTLAHLEALSPRFIVFCPAYPRQGRIVVQGRVWVHGQSLLGTEYASDPLSPARQEQPQRLFPKGLAAEIRLRDLRQGKARAMRAMNRALALGARVLCLDAEHEADLDEGVKAALSLGCRDFTGASALVDSLAKQLPGRHALGKVRLPKQRMILAGSLSHTTERQIQRLEDALPGSSHALGAAEILGAKAVKHGPGQRILALRSLAGRLGLAALRRAARRRGLEPDALAERSLERLVRQGLKLAGRPDLVLWFLTGGHTLRVFQAALGLKGVWAWGEPYAGAPLVQGLRKQGKPVWMLSKPGGFGDEDLFLRFVHEQ